MPTAVPIHIFQCSSKSIYVITMRPLVVATIHHLHQQEEKVWFLFWSGVVFVFLGYWDSFWKYYDRNKVWQRQDGWLTKWLFWWKGRKSTKDQEMKNKTSIDGIDIWDTEAGRAVSALQLPVVIWWLWWWWWRWRWYVMTNIFAVKLEPTSLRFVLPVPTQCWKASIW